MEIKVSPEQFSDMKHSIGLDERSKLKTRKGIKHYEAYRNYYAAGYKPMQRLEELVSIGLMKSWTKKMGDSEPYYYYCVSAKGLEFLENMFGIKITERR